MSIQGYQSAFNGNSIVQNIGNTINQQEQDLMQQMNQLGPNPSSSDLAIFQFNSSQWSNMVMLESSLFKQQADTMKAVVQNVGA